MQVRLFASAREAAGRRADDFEARTLGEVLELMAGRYGVEFAAVLARSRVWVNGDEPSAGTFTELHDGDEVAVLPPVSGGASDSERPMRLPVVAFVTQVPRRPLVPSAP